MSYITSGQFLIDVEAATGEKYQRDLDDEGADPSVGDQDGATSEEDDDDAPFDYAGFPAALKAELQALAALREKGAVPALLGLRHGDYVPLPWQEGADQDEVLEDWFRGDEKTTELVMRAVSIVHPGGGVYFVVEPSGRMGVLTEDPYGYASLACSYDDFLRALTLAHSAARTEGLDAAAAALLKVVDAKRAKTLLMRAETGSEAEA